MKQKKYTPNITQIWYTHTPLKIKKINKTNENENRKKNFNFQKVKFVINKQTKKILFSFYSLHLLIFKSI